ncbi:hypothetical protein [Amphritea sp. HPY]|uniref:hypothetical protein n=1 Tax=Amphritea sp. HPY TaxID=3421652 RepID=UPI003D7EB1DE
MNNNSSASDLIESLEQLQTRLNGFAAQLASNQLPFWLPGLKPANLSSAAALYSDIWYRDGRDGRTTISHHGLIGADAALIKQALLVNQAKCEFQRHATQYRLSKDLPLQQQLHLRSEKLATLLHFQGASRLHLKQCYRHIPVLETAPVKIGFSWYTSGRSIKKLTPQQALDRLMKMDTSQTHIQRQIEAVGRLRPGDLLAQIQTLAPVIRANMLWKEQDQLIRKAKNISLPILVALNPANPVLPEYNEPPLSPPDTRSRLERNDLKIDPDLFLPSLRAHRYLG